MLKTFLVPQPHLIRHFASKVLPDYYKILKITPSASSAEIKQSYYKLAKELHPDLQNEKKITGEQFK